jgi:hypothetical protein
VSTNGSKFKVAWWFLIVGILIIAGVGIDMFAENAKPSTKILSSVKVDGNVMPGEYTHHFFDKKSKYDLYWRVIGKDIYFAMHSPKKGWVAVGLGAKKAMQDADIYIAYVKGGKAYLSEEYGNTPFSHVPIKNVGGKPVVKKYAGKVCSKGIFIEFERPLKVNSKFAKSIEKKNMNVIFAYSTAADFTTYHGAGSRGTTKINFLATSTGKKSSGPGMWVEDVKSYQIAFLIWGVLFLMASFIAFVTTAIEGDTSKPIYEKKNKVGSGPFMVIGFLGLFDIFLVVLFIIELFSKTTPTARGLTMSLAFFVLAVITALYRHYFIDENVTMHEMDDELPW